MPIIRMQAAVYLVACIFGMVCVSLNSATASVSGNQNEMVSPEDRAPYEVVKVFMEAVDRGEVAVFGHMLKRVSLIPMRVEYMYELTDLSASVKIFADLVHPISVPDLQNMKVYGISVTLDPEGNITEISAFVKAVKTELP